MVCGGTIGHGYLALLRADAYGLFVDGSISYRVREPVFRGGSNIRRSSPRPNRDDRPEFNYYVIITPCTYRRPRRYAIRNGCCNVTVIEGQVVVEGASRPDRRGVRGVYVYGKKSSKEYTGY